MCAHGANHRFVWKECLDQFNLINSNFVAQPIFNCTFCVMCTYLLSSISYTKEKRSMCNYFSTWCLQRRGNLKGKTFCKFNDFLWFRCYFLTSHFFWRLQASTFCKSNYLHTSMCQCNACKTEGHKKFMPKAREFFSVPAPCSEKNEKRGEAPETCMLFGSGLSCRVVVSWAGTRTTDFMMGDWGSDAVPNQLRPCCQKPERALKLDWLPLQKQIQ